jgi:trigger factor
LTVNETIVMTVVHMDYKGQVQKKNKRKMPLATVKGFRRGCLKILLKKQYGKTIKQEV